MKRRLPALVVTVVAILALVVAGRTAPAEVVPVFSAQGTEWMPFAPGASGLTGYWFCPGVPATGVDGVGGELIVANSGEAEMSARVELLNDAGGSAVQTITVPALGRTVFDVDAALQGQFVSAVVEIEGGGGIVEQRAIHPAGTAVAPCANSTSSEWYLAEGFTVGGSVNQIVLTNPYDDTVLVDVGFATVEGSRTPATYQSFPIGPRSVEVIDLGVAGGGGQGEELLAVKVVATRGRLVVGRAQHYLAGGRLGYTMALGSPAARDQWWFADGVKGPGFTERFSLYNPTEDDVEVDVFFLGTASQPTVDPIVVPARQVVAFEPGTVATLAEGRHAVVFSTLAEPSIVVERTLTRTSDGTTSVLLGAPPRADAYVAATWRLAAGPAAAGDGSSLTVYTPDNVAGTVTVEAVTADGVVPIPGLEELAIGGGGRLEIPLDHELAVGHELIVRSTSRIFVERSLPSGLESGRSTAWALPQG